MARVRGHQEYSIFASWWVCKRVDVDRGAEDIDAVRFQRVAKLVHEVTGRVVDRDIAGIRVRFGGIDPRSSTTGLPSSRRTSIAGTAAARAVVNWLLSAIGAPGR